MLEKPGGADLLATARDLLLAELLPALPPDKVFAARMVANAMAIAARGLAVEAQAEAALQARLAALVGEGADPLARLAAGIRAGRFDGDEAVRNWLRDAARLRARVSAPRALG